MYIRLIGICILSTITWGCTNSQERKLTADINLSPVIHLHDTGVFAPSWSKENTLVYHLTSEPDNLHPSNGASSPRSEILLYTQAFLLITDFEKQSFAPGLSTNLPEISKDGLSYTYVLRKEVRWDNGEALSADDVIFTAKAYKCPLTNNPSVKSYWKNLKTIVRDSLDPLKFTVVMKEYNMQNISFITSFCIMQRSFLDPQSILKNYTFEQLDDPELHPENKIDLLNWAKNFNDEKYGRDPEYLNGLGRYKVINWEPGQSITIVKKEDHWADKTNDPAFIAYPEKIIFKVNKDDNSVQLEFKTQALDVSGNLSMGTFLSLSQNPGVDANYHHVLSLTYNYTYLAFNQKPDTTTRNKLFTNKKVRRALAHLTPVEELTKLIYKEYSPYCKRMISNVSPIKPDFNSNLKAIEFNIDKARQILADEGWKDSDADGILDKIIDGKKIPFQSELIYMNTSPDWKDMALHIAESYSKVGISIELKPVDLRVFLESAREHNFDLLLGSWGGTAFPEDFSQLWHSSSWENNGSNYSGFGNEQSDALIDSIKTEIDNEKRKKLVLRFQELIYDDQPYVFLFCSMRRNLVHKRFGNISLFADRPGMLLNSFKLLSTTVE